MDPAELRSQRVAGFGELGYQGGDVECEPVDLRAEDPWSEVAVDVGGDADVAVPEDSLHRQRARAGLHQQARGRVTEVVKPERPDLRLRPELSAVDRAASQVRVRSFFRVLAALPPARVDVASGEPRARHRTAENGLDGELPRAHRAVGCGEDELGRRGPHRGVEEGNDLGGEGNPVGMTALRRVPVPRARHGEEAGLEVAVLLPERHELALAEAGIDDRREEGPEGRVEHSEARRNPMRGKVVGRAAHHARRFTADCPRQG